MKYKDITFFLLTLMLVFFSNRTICQTEDSSRIGGIVNSYEFHLPQYTIIDTILPASFGNQNVFEYIQMSSPSFGVMDSLGFPELPFIIYNLELPYYAQNIEVTMTGMQYDTIQMDYHILPNQGDFNKSDTNNSPPTFHYNDAFYSSHNTFMTVDCQQMDTFIIRGIKGVAIAVMPFKYNPYRKQLQVLKAAQMNVCFLAGREREIQPQSDTWENILQSLFVNHSPSSRLSTAEKFLILTLPNH